MQVDAATSTGSPFLLRQLQQRGICNGGDMSEAEHAVSFNPELFFKMSHEVYSYGEGLMGKVAADNIHKWVYREAQEQGISLLSPWPGSLDPHPRTWEGQFKAGIQTIALVPVEGGLLQLGSTLKIVEDLNIVILLQHKFNYLQSIPGVFVSHPTPMSTSGGKTRRAAYHQAAGEAESPPSDQSGNWITSPDLYHHTRFLSNGLISPTAIDQFLSSRLAGMNGSSRYAAVHDSAASILGIKRPQADMDCMPGLPFDFDDYPGYYSSSPGKLQRSGGSYGSRDSECPSSPPKAALNNTGTPLQSGNSSNLLPSMSSLQALLSKLPSVTPKELAAAAASNHAAGLRQRQQLMSTDSPASVAPQLHAATTSSSSPTASTNYGSPPVAIANPVPADQTNKNSSPAGAVQQQQQQIRMSSSSPHHDRHRSSSPDQNPHAAGGADHQSDSTRPATTSTSAAESDTLTTTAAAASNLQSRLTCNQMINGNYCNGSGPSAAEELQHPVTVLEQSAASDNTAPGFQQASRNSCTANAAASSSAGTPSSMQQLSADSVIKNSDQRNNNFHHHQQEQQEVLAGAAADHVSSYNLRRRAALASLYQSRLADQPAPGPFKDKPMASCCITATSLDQAATFVDCNQQQESFNFSFQEALESNSNIYDSYIYEM